MRVSHASWWEKTPAFCLPGGKLPFTRPSSQSANILSPQGYTRGGHSRGTGDGRDSIGGGTSPRSATATVRAGNEIEFYQLNFRKYKYSPGRLVLLPFCLPTSSLISSPPPSNLVPSFTAKESSGPSLIRSLHLELVLRLLHCVPHFKFNAYRVRGRNVSGSRVLLCLGGSG